MTKITLGLIGLGNILPYHLQAILANPEYQITSVCDSAPDKTSKVSGELNCPGFTDYRDLLERKPQVVTVNLPHYLHFPAVMDALAAGCHILVEKPLAISITELKTILKVARAREKIVLVTDTSYWLPETRLARNLVATESFGRFLMGSFTNYRFYFAPDRPRWFLDPATSGGGQFINLGVHRIAAVRTVLGDNYHELSVTASVHHPSSEYKIETAVKAMVLYDTGSAMTYEECGYFQPPENLPTGFFLLFEKAVMGITQNQVWISNLDGKVHRHEVPASPEAGPYEAFYRQMRRAQIGKPYYPQLYHGANDARIALAAYASAQQHKTIELSDPEWELFN